MSDDEESISRLDDLPLPAEKRFTTAQMIACPACLRANPPTRTNCLYCLAGLPVPEGTAALRKPTLRPLEDWEQGYNNILVKGGSGDPPPQLLGELASFLRLDPEDVKRVFSRGGTVPLARPANPEEASLIEDRLRGLGVETVVVSDVDLAVEKMPPKRIRSLELLDDAVVGREPGSESPLSIPWTEVYLIVAGRLFVTRVEVEENKFRRGKQDVVDVRELNDDEAVLDIYTGQQDGGWRIVSGSFDFSCLGDRKGLLASGNYLALTDVLRQRAPEAEFDDSYVRVRQALTVIWPMIRHTEGGGFRRARPGKYNVGTLTTSDNETQFTRYSRLRHYLRLRGF